MMQFASVRVCLVLLFMCSCSAQAHVTIEGATIRMMPPGSPATSVYLTLTNDTRSPITFKLAESPSAGRVEFHTHQHQQGVMRMVQLPSLTVKPGETVRFQPGGLHIMVFDLIDTLTEGQHVKLTLISALGSRFEFEAVAVMPGDEQKHHH